MDTALPQKFPFILDRNLAKANCTGNRVCTSCDIVLLGRSHKILGITHLNFDPRTHDAIKGPSRVFACQEGMTMNKVFARLL